MMNLEVFYNAVKLLKANMWNLATCSDGNPNVVPVAFKDVTEGGKLVVGDVLPERRISDIFRRSENKPSTGLASPLQVMAATCPASLNFTL